MPLGALPTPLAPWSGVPGVPDGCELYIKRDDLSGMQLSGNKVRARTSRAPAHSDDALALAPVLARGDAGPHVRLCLHTHLPMRARRILEKYVACGNLDNFRKT